MDRHRLSLVQHQDARARCVPKAYQAKYNDYPRLGSIVGYQTIKSAAAILTKANSTDPEKLIAATEGLSLPSPFGEITFRKIDHQSTLGAFVGKTALKDGKGVMVDSVYRKGSDYLPSDAEVDKLRPKDLSPLELTPVGSK